MPNTKKYLVTFFQPLIESCGMSYGRMANWNSIHPDEQTALF
jgi:hypothetical protein